MSSRTLAELRAFSERLGLATRTTRKFPWDVPAGSGAEGFYGIGIGADQNPKPGAEEIFLGKTPDEAKVALTRLADAGKHLKTKREEPEVVGEQPVEQGRRRNMKEAS